MSIASRIESITENLENAYNSLENIGVDLTGVNKNISNLSTEIDDLYPDLKKVTAENIKVSLMPTKQGKMESILKGNMSQFTTTGKNMFNYDDLGSVSGGTINNKIITSSTKDNENLHLHVYLTHYFSINSGDTIYFSADIKLNGNSTATYSTINDGVNLSTKILSPTLSNKYQRYQTSITYSENTNLNHIFFQIFSLTGTIEISNIMFSKNSNVSFEPYTGTIASPNPNYPQTVKRVTGQNNIMITGKNLSNFENPSGCNKCSYDSSTKIYTSDEFSSSYTGMNIWTNPYIVLYPGTNEFYYSADIRLKSGTYNNVLNLIRTGSNTLINTTTVTAINNPVLSNEFQRYIFKASYTNNNNYSLLDNNYFIQLKTGASNAVFEIKNVMISYSDGNVYEPHNSQFYPIDFSTMEFFKNSDGTVKDYIDGTIDNWNKKERIKKVILTGQEDWEEVARTYTTFQIKDFMNSDGVQYWENATLQFCTHFQIGRAGYVNANCCSIDELGSLYMTNLNITTLEDWTQWLKDQYDNGTPVIYYYVSQTTDTIPISDANLISQLNDIANNLKSYKNETNIIQRNNADLPLYIDASALLKSS